MLVVYCGGNVIGQILKSVTLSHYQEILDTLAVLLPNTFFGWSQILLRLRSQERMTFTPQKSLECVSIAT